LAKLSANMW